MSAPDLCLNVSRYYRCLLEKWRNELKAQVLSKGWPSFFCGSLAVQCPILPLSSALVLLGWRIGAGCGDWSITGAMSLKSCAIVSIQHPECQDHMLLKGQGRLPTFAAQYHGLPSPGWVLLGSEALPTFII